MKSWVIKCRQRCMLLQDYDPKERDNAGLLHLLHMKDSAQKKAKNDILGMDRRKATKTERKHFG